MNEMKKLILLLALTLSTITYSQKYPSQWELGPEHQVQFNYNLLGRHVSQGLFYGAAGYGTGMWLSGNNSWWGIAGSVIATNIPILFEKKFDEPEVVLGRNIGMMTISLSATIVIETTRDDKFDFELPPFLRRLF